MGKKGTERAGSGGAPAARRLRVTALPHLPEQTHLAALYLQNTAFASHSFGTDRNTENSSSGNSATVVLVLLSSLKRGCACEPCWSLHTSVPPLLAPVLCSGGAPLPFASPIPVIAECQGDSLELPLESWSGPRPTALQVLE